MVPLSPTVISLRTRIDIGGSCIFPFAPATVAEHVSHIRQTIATAFGEHPDHRAALGERRRDDARRRLAQSVVGREVALEAGDSLSLVDQILGRGTTISDIALPGHDNQMVASSGFVEASIHTLRVRRAGSNDRCHETSYPRRPLTRDRNIQIGEWMVDLAADSIDGPSQFLRLTTLRLKVPLRDVVSIQRHDEWSPP